jgi:hypothetical protein
LGFYPTEGDANDEPFNWLNTQGKIDVGAAPGVAPMQFWLRFLTESGDHRREFIVAAPHFKQTVVAPPLGHPHTVTVGPLTLRGGRTTITIASVELPNQHGSDIRLLSVRVARLEALLSPEAP